MDESIVLERCLNGFYRHGCNNKVNKEETLSLIDSKIAERLNILNSTLADLDYGPLTLNCYKHFRYNLLHKDIRGYCMISKNKLNSLIKMKNLIEEDELANLFIRRSENRKIGETRFFIGYHHIPKDIRDVYFSKCVEDSNSLLTIKFKDIFLSLCYKDTQLFEIFNGNIDEGLLNRVKGDKSHFRILKDYLVVRTYGEDYKSEDLYLDNSGAYDIADRELGKLLEGSRAMNLFNPRVEWNKFLVSLLDEFKYSTLYHLNGESITLKLNGSENLTLTNVVKKIDSALEGLEIAKLPYKFIGGSSLVENLNDVDRIGVEVFDGKIIDKSQAFGIRDSNIFNK